MSTVAAQSPFMKTLLGGEPAGASGTAWLDRLRAGALERANSVPLPTTRDEAWRFTDLAPLTRLSFQPVVEAADVAQDDVRDRCFPDSHARLVFVDGVWSSELSQVSAGDGVAAMNLREAMAKYPALVEQHLGKLARSDSNVFDALNTAYLRHAAVIVVADECSAPRPVHVLQLATGRPGAHALYPRVLVVAGSRSRCTVIEDFVALAESVYFSAPVTEIVVGPQAAVSHVRLQREAPDAFQIGSCNVSQDRASSYQSIHVALGARISRLELNVTHTGVGCETRIDGLALIGRRQLADTHSFVDHAHPEGKLRQVHKCVAGAGAHAVFNGKILVREGAQRTDAGQSCRGLLLSDRAHIDVKPQLEIFADDVKCAHGAAIGQLDPDELFYLQSRGLAHERARNLLTYAFAAEVIERVPVAAIRTRLAHTVLERTQEPA